ncbi:uncharacterized protein LOC144903892 [Branchiostoma floridae x Branchiostoma belcheri]
MFSPSMPSGQTPIASGKTLQSCSGLEKNCRTGTTVDMNACKLVTNEQLDKGQLQCTDDGASPRTIYDTDGELVQNDVKHVQNNVELIQNDVELVQNDGELVQNNRELVQNDRELHVDGNLCADHVVKQIALAKTKGCERSTFDQGVSVEKVSKTTVENDSSSSVKMVGEVDHSGESGRGGISEQAPSVEQGEKEILDVVGGFHDGLSNSRMTKSAFRAVESAEGSRSDTPTKKQFKSEFKGTEEVRTWSHELQQGYRILREIMVDHYKNISWPFVNPVDVEGENLWDYNDRIKQPMCLRKIKDKFHNSEYSSITEFVADMRLVLENCYRYNGINHYVSKQAQKMEKVLEQKLALLSKTLREKTTLHMTSGGKYGEDPGSKRRSVVRSLQVTHDQTGSVLLTYIRTEIEAQEKEDRRLRELEKREEWQKQQQEILDWENKLLEETHLKELWEIPAIGHFLCLAQQILNIPEVVFYELERGLAMPQASSTLAMVYTYLLCTPHQRTKLPKKPHMPYSIWNKKLKERLQEWYDILDEQDTYEDAADYIGITREFFHELGETNPLVDQQYHELPFRQRVWILKSLCDNVYWSEVEIQETVDGLPVFEQREVILGYDADGCAYLHFPQFCGADLRIYKQRPLPVPCLQKTEKKIKKNLNQLETSSQNAETKAEEGETDRQKTAETKDVKHENEDIKGSENKDDEHQEDESLLKVQSSEKTKSREGSPTMEERGQGDATTPRTSSTQEQTVSDPTQTTSEPTTSVSKSRHECSKVKTEETSVEKLSMEQNSHKGSGDGKLLHEEVTTESATRVKKRKQVNRDSNSALRDNERVHRASKRRKVVLSNSQDTASPDVEGLHAYMSPRRSKRQKNKVEMYTTPDHRQSSRKLRDNQADTGAGKISSSKKKRKKKKTKDKTNSCKSTSAELEEGPEFMTACESVEELRTLTAQFAQPTAEDILKCNKLGKSPHRKRSVVELHQVLQNLLTELEPWEQKLVKARTKARNKLLSEWRDFQSAPPSSEEVVDVWGDSEEEVIEAEEEELQEEVQDEEEEAEEDTALSDEEWTIGSKRAGTVTVAAKGELGRLRPRKRICTRETETKQAVKVEKAAKEPLSVACNIWDSLKAPPGHFSASGSQPQTAAQLLLSMKTKCSVASPQLAQNSVTVNKAPSQMVHLRKNVDSNVPQIIQLQQEGVRILGPKKPTVAGQHVKQILPPNQSGATTLKVPVVQMSTTQQTGAKGVKGSPKVPQILQLQTSGSSQPIYLLQQVNEQGQVVYLQLQPTSNYGTTASSKTVTGLSNIVTTKSEGNSNLVSPQISRPKLQPETLTSQQHSNVRVKKSNMDANLALSNKGLQNQVTARLSATSVQQQDHTVVGQLGVTQRTIATTAAGNVKLTSTLLNPTVLQQNASPVIVKPLTAAGSEGCQVVAPLAKAVAQFRPTTPQLMQAGTKVVISNVNQAQPALQQRPVTPQLVQRGLKIVSADVQQNQTNLPAGTQLIKTGVPAGKMYPVTTPFAAQGAKVVHASTLQPTVQPVLSPNTPQAQPRLQLVQLKSVPIPGPGQGKTQGQIARTVPQTQSNLATTNTPAQVMHFKLSPMLLSPVHSVPQKEVEGSSNVASSPRTQHSIQGTNVQPNLQLTGGTANTAATAQLKSVGSGLVSQPSLQQQLMVSPPVQPLLQSPGLVTANGILLQPQAKQEAKMVTESPTVVQVSHGAQQQILKQPTQGASADGVPHQLVTPASVGVVKSTPQAMPLPQPKVVFSYLKTNNTPARSIISNANAAIQGQTVNVHTRLVAPPLSVTDGSKSLGVGSQKPKQREVLPNVTSKVHGENVPPSKIQTVPVSPGQRAAPKLVGAALPSPRPVVNLSSSSMPHQTRTSPASQNTVNHSAGRQSTLIISPSLLQGLPVHTAGGLNYVQLLLNQGGVKTMLAVPVQVQPGGKVVIPTGTVNSLQTTVSASQPPVRAPSGQQTATSHLQGHVNQPTSSVQVLTQTTLTGQRQPGGKTCALSSPSTGTLAAPVSCTGISPGTPNVCPSSVGLEANRSTNVCCVELASTFSSVPANPQPSAGAATQVVSRTMSVPIMSPGVEQTKGHVGVPKTHTTENDTNSR